MSGSIYGNIFRISTFGESHGKALGVIIDGCPAGIELNAEDIQRDMDRRKPGSNKYGTKRQESDSIEILSGVFEGVTTGTPIALMLMNTDQRSKDYSDICDIYRPGHADYCYEQKYGIRDYRGGGRSSARETSSRVAAGAVARKLLKELNIDICAYSIAIGNVKAENIDIEKRFDNPLCMPDMKAYERASALLDEAMKDCDSVGGVIECRVTGLPAGLGEPVFDKLDACISKAVMSMGATKGIEFGDGFRAAEQRGSYNNDSFFMSDGRVAKRTNHSGGVLGGMSDGSSLVFRAAFKPTPSIAKPQETVNKYGEEKQIRIKGRHDPIVVPRAVVVVEAMTAITLADLLLENMSAKMENIKKIYL